MILLIKGIPAITKPYPVKTGYFTQREKSCIICRGKTIKGTWDESLGSLFVPNPVD
jgi:hypothetical protein